MTTLRTSLLCVASAAVIASQAAIGQETDNTTDQRTLDTVVVTGIQQSLQESIAAKRDADAIIDVITATDIGKFPDKNVAESLQRVTGISIRRDFGEGERVAIRGVASNRNLTLLNGHSVATADWFILDQLAATRSFNYLLLPSEVVGTVEVYKSGQANVNEGGVGGVVNVTTRKPLDLDPFEARLSVQGVYSELADDTSPAISGLLSWKNEAETFGVLLSATSSQREVRRDGVEVLGYRQQTIADQGGASLEVPDLIGSALFLQDRDRIGGNLTVQYAPNSNFEIVGNAFYSEMEANNVNYNYLAWISQLMGAGSQPTNTTVGADGTLLSGTFALNPAANGVVYDTIVRDASTSVSAFDIDTTYSLSDSLTLHGKIGYTEADGATERQPFWEVNAPTGLTYDLTSGTPVVTFTDIDPTSAVDAQSLALGWASLNIVENTDEEFFVYGDVTKEFDSGPFKSVEAGIKFTEHERDVIVTYGQTRSLLGAPSPACGNAVCNLATVLGGASTPSDFLGNIGGGALDNFLLADVGAINDVYGQLNFGTTFPDFFHSGPLDSFTVNEQVLAGYVMGNYEVDRLRGNIGLRIVETDQTVDGFSVGVDPATPGSFDNPFGRTLATSENKKYTDILPSANMVFELSDDLLLRASASRVLARADYNQLAGAVSLTPNLLTGAGGNSNLDPFRATAFDAGFEWYRNDDSLLAVAMFYKDIESYITSSSFTERQPLSIATPLTDPRVLDASNNCAATPSASDPNLFTCDFQISRPVNGAGGRNQGIEVSYQQPIGYGLGFIANYTYTDAESDDGAPVPENSQNTVNLTGYYENDWLSARLSYNYRDEYFIGVDRNRNLFSKPTDTIDGSVTWDVHPNFALTLEGVNLTEEVLEQYYENEGRPARLYDNGRVIYFGVKAAF